MSYVCYATDELVIGESREMVPIRIRKVIYIAQTKPDPRSDYLQFASQSEGWEVMEEVPVRRSAVDAFRAAHPPVIGEEKEVRYMKPIPKKEKYNKYGDNQDEDFKPDDL
jgi:hypothetical protein